MTRNFPPDHLLPKKFYGVGKGLVSLRDAGERMAADDTILTHTDDFVGQSAASGKRPVRDCGTQARGRTAEDNAELTCTEQNYPPLLG